VSKHTRMSRPATVDAIIAAFRRDGEEPTGAMIERAQQYAAMNRSERRWAYQTRSKKRKP
jgi:hypothetical protein